jgi:hypothetical protein
VVLNARRSVASLGPRSVEHQASISLRADGGVRLAVVADTHGRPHPKSSELIAIAKPDAILHAGDIGDLDVLEQLRKIAPLFAVRGNIDGRAADLPDVLDIHVKNHAGPEAGGGFKILLLHIGVNGPKLRADAGRLARQRSAQVVVCGHSHVPFIGRDRGLVVFNPGSVGPRRFTLPIVFGLLELKRSQLHLWHVDCETGEKWTPP